MKRNNYSILVCGLLALSLNSCNKKESNEGMTFEKEIDKVSYSLGINIGQNIKKQLDSLNTEAFAKGLNDVYSGDSTHFLIQGDEAEKILNEYFRKIQEAKFLSVKEEGAKFLEQNQSKEGVVTLPSGLQYKIVKEGKGPKPLATDFVKTHYHGTTMDGKVFDSSVDRKEPVVFPVNGVIPGWSEALQLMPVGSKWQLFVPANLAYGERGAGPNIPPFATLIFDVELISIEKDPAKK